MEQKCIECKLEMTFVSATSARFKLEQPQRERLRWQIIDENIFWIHMYCNFRNVRRGKNVLCIIKMALMPVRVSDDGYHR